VESLDSNPDAGLCLLRIVTTDEQRPCPSSHSVKFAHPSDERKHFFSTLMLAGYFPPHTVMIGEPFCKRWASCDLSLGGQRRLRTWLRVSAAGYKGLFRRRPTSY